LLGNGNSLPVDADGSSGRRWPAQAPREAVLGTQTASARLNGQLTIGSGWTLAARTASGPSRDVYTSAASRGLYSRVLFATVSTAHRSRRPISDMCLARCRPNLRSVVGQQNVISTPYMRPQFESKIAGNCRRESGKAEGHASVTCATNGLLLQKWALLHGYQTQLCQRLFGQCTMAQCPALRYKSTRHLYRPATCLSASEVQPTAWLLTGVEIKTPHCC